MGACRLHGDAAGTLQPLGISEGDAGHPCPVPAWVDTDEKPPFPVVVVILPVKSLHHLHRLRVIQKGVDHLKSSRQNTGIGELLIE